MLNPLADTLPDDASHPKAYTCSRCLSFRLTCLWQVGLVLEVVLKVVFGGALLLPMLEGFMTIMRHGATSRHSLMHCIRGIRVDSSFVDRSLQRLNMSIRAVSF